MQRIFTLLILWTILGGAPALVLAYSGTDGAAFLDIPVGAGPAALGSAYTALANDAYAPVWNPAGLGFLESTQVAAQHLSYLDSIHYEFASAAVPLWKSTYCASDDQCGGTSIGGALQYLGAGDITGRDSLGNATGNFTSHYAAGTLGYGKAITEKIAIGIAGKGIQGQLDDVSATAFAADFGLMAKPTERLTLAAVAANVGSKLTFLDQADPLPLEARAGAAYQGRNWTFTGEGVFPRTGLNSAHAGVEWHPISIMALRAGYRTDTLKELSPIAGFSTGIGIDLWGQEFAYAWVPYGELGNTQYFSLVLRWGEAERRKRNLIYFHSIKKHQDANDMDPNSPEFHQLIELMTYSEQRVAAVPSMPIVPEQLGQQNVMHPMPQFIAHQVIPLAPVATPATLQERRQ